MEVILFVSIFFAASYGIRMREAVSKRTNLLQEAKQFEFRSPTYNELMQEVDEQNRIHRELEGPFVIALIIATVALLQVLS